MNWESVKGISTVVNFSEHYLSKGSINKNLLFNKPDRKKWGYLWELSSEYISGMDQNSGIDITGILITNDIDARVVQGIFNRCLFNLNKNPLLNGIKSMQSTQGNLNLSDAAMDKIRWETYYDILKTLYSTDYIPLKRYLSEPVKEKIWIPLLGENDSMDKFSRKSYYQYIKWVIGNDTIILEIPDRYEKMWQWKKAVALGAMENPELLFLEDFATEYPGSIKHIPEKIVEKLDIQPLRDLDYFGISFH